jgi:nucleotide-binding universal stress UspA family protein
MKPISSTNETAAGRSCPDPSTRRILVAEFDRAPSHAFVRARAIASQFGAELRVLHLGRNAQHGWQHSQLLAPGELSFMSSGRGGGVADSQKSVEVRPSNGPEHAIAALDSSVERALVRAAARLPAWLIVVPRHAALGGWAARRVALCAGVPVLVASRCTTNGGIVAASDLADQFYPVLRRGAELGERLQTVVTFVHNLNAGSDRPARTAAERLAETLADKLAELRRAGRSFGIECPSVVMTRSDPEDAILDLAQRQRTDMIVVGTGRHAPRTLPTHDSVAASVIERADGSVLVLPLTGRGHRRERDSSHLPREIGQVDHDGWMPVAVRGALRT